MTFKEEMIKNLTTKGMFTSQAEEVMEEYMRITSDTYLHELWSQDTGGYPSNITDIIWDGVKAQAFRWIVMNVPQAWYRPMFEYTDAELMVQQLEKEMQWRYTCQTPVLQG